MFSSSKAGFFFSFSFLSVYRIATQRPVGWFSIFRMALNWVLQMTDACLVRKPKGGWWRSGSATMWSVWLDLGVGSPRTICEMYKWSCECESTWVVSSLSNGRPGMHNGCLEGHWTGVWCIANNNNRSLIMFCVGEGGMLHQMINLIDLHVFFSRTSFFQEPTVGWGSLFEFEGAAIFFNWLIEFINLIWTTNSCTEFFTYLSFFSSVFRLICLLIEFFLIVMWWG